jgi:hypothetical protein
MEGVQAKDADWYPDKTNRKRVKECFMLRMECIVPDVYSCSKNEREKGVTPHQPLSVTMN